MSLVRVRRRELTRLLPGDNETVEALEAAFVATARALGILTASKVLEDGDFASFDATGAAKIATLPAPAPGARVTVKLAATASAHTLTVARSGSGVKIDGTAADLSTSTVGTVFRLVSDGTDWYVY